MSTLTSIQDDELQTFTDDVNYLFFPFLHFSLLCTDKVLSEPRLYLDLSKCVLVAT